MDEEYEVFVGIDWATAAHQVCLVDRRGQVRGERSVAHTASALAALVEWVRDAAGGQLGGVAVAIEIPRGAVVETLVEQGVAVYALNPKQLDRFRDRHAVAGAKDDRRDAFVLADSLRTDRHCFRRVALDDPVVIELREVARADAELAEELTRLTNRLREQLHRFYPQPLALAPAADEPWLWALLERAPTPAAARRLRLRAVEKLLGRYRVRRLVAADVLATLQTAALRVAPGVTEGATAHIALLLPRLRLVHAQRRDCAAALERLLAQLAAAGGEDGTQRPRDVTILRSLPGAGRIVTATLLAEAPAALQARDYHALRGHTGLAPVTRQSGKHRVVIMRRACNGRLREACFHWARVAAQIDPPSRAYYAALRSRGHTHGRALRAVGDRLLRILIAMLTTGTLYDPQRGRRRGAASAAA